MCVRACSQGDFEYMRWWRSLGVTPPSDYTDPELLFDQLPQPYRTILKVLEQDIVDGKGTEGLNQEEGRGGGWCKSCAF